MKFSNARTLASRIFSATLPLSLAALALTMGLSLGRAEADTITLPVPNVSETAPAVTTNSRCHILVPQRLPGYAGPQSAPVYPDCDPRSHPAPRSGQLNGTEGGFTPAASCNANPSCFTWSFGFIVQAAQETLMYLNCASTCWGDPQTFETDLLDSAYIHVVDQYMTGAGVHKTSGRYTVNPTTISLTGTQPHTLAQSDTETLIINAINAQFPGGCGGGTSCGGYTHMYGLFLPSGQDFCNTTSSSCYCPDNNCGAGNTFTMCGYHASFDTNDAVGSNVHIIYQAMGYANVTDSSNGLNCDLDSNTSASEADSQNSELLHETLEAITDPDPDSGWVNGDNEEVGDPCTTNIQNPILLHTHSYATQEIGSNFAGGACVGYYAALATVHDFNADMNSDILWRNTSSGQLALWEMNGSALAGSANISTVSTVWAVAGSRDFNGNNTSDVLWLDTSGDVGLWLMSGSTVSSHVSLGNVGSQWTVVGTGDFNDDGVGDILWRNTSTGAVAIWLMNSSGQFSSGVGLGTVSTVWQVAGTGDFNGNGVTDILWHNTSTGDYSIWLINSSAQFSSGVDLGVVQTAWSVVGTGDFNGDGISDILWRNSSNHDLAIWEINSSGQLSSSANLGSVPVAWSVAETGDYDGDGRSDILWVDTSGNLGIWFMNGTTASSMVGVGNVSTTWTVQAKAAE